MRKILFITTRNIITTCGELRLIKNRAETLFDDYDVKTDIVAFAKKGRLNQVSEDGISAGGITEYVVTDVKNPLSVLSSFNKLKRIVLKKIKSTKYDAFILSGVGTHFLASSIKRVSNSPIVLDCHGAYETPKYLATGKSLKDRVWYNANSYFDRIGMKFGFKYFDGCFVASHALIGYLKERYRVPDRVSFYVVPCATTSTVITDEEYSKYRVMFRNKYNINDDDVVFVYSGGISKWQCIAETIDLYRALEKKFSGKSRMLLFSHDVTAIQGMIKEGDTIYTDSYSPDELTKALCAGDYAFLLRKNSIVNYVAYPNKFLEYLRSRLKVITTPYVEAVSSQIKEHDAGCIIEFDNYNDYSGDVEAVVKFVCEHKNTDVEVELLERILRANSFHTTLQQFCIDLNNNSIGKGNVKIDAD